MSWAVIIALAAVVAFPFVIYGLSWVLALTSRENWTIPKQGDADDSTDDFSTPAP